MAAAKETGKVVTVEEHSVIGGLGSAVCDALAEKNVRQRCAKSVLMMYLVNLVRQ